MTEELKRGECTLNLESFDVPEDRRGHRTCHSCGSQVTKAWVFHGPKKRPNEMVTSHREVILCEKCAEKLRDKTTYQVVT